MRVCPQLCGSGESAVDDDHFARDEAIRFVYRTRGTVGRQMISELDDLRAYASEEEIDRWQESLLEIVSRIKREESERVTEDPAQLKMFE